MDTLISFCRYALLPEMTQRVAIGKAVGNALASQVAMSTPNKLMCRRPRTGYFRGVHSAAQLQSRSCASSRDSLWKSGQNEEVGT